MRIAITVFVVILALALIGWCLGGTGVHPAKMLPFLGGHDVGAYDVGAVIMLLILILGLRRLWIREQD